MRERERGRQSKKETLNCRGQTDGYRRGMGEMVKQVMGIKKPACHDELRVMYGTVGPLYCTPETKITLC